VKLTKHVFRINGNSVAALNVIHIESFTNFSNKDEFFAQNYKLRNSKKKSNPLEMQKQSA
jgi:hypothetical protein